ncbi:DUF1778 domain-containing protein [Muricauda sp. SCSIO 64092]|uniref:type II toxin-antitoxin system TacA family antitoxin n=1 Tax=Allomuricauda sp. SCSIO 64092 TaxID=2908842 RepID=UPI001FF4C963|nr:DUF1778 domain-containing protein [Muricauda sp. SCSIO 64092]UOY06696.1 DUF1778 domain-containing protein [Muricauda sp. SCSIO 64092]
MGTEAINEEKARFDTRLPKKQKIFFERAARLGGFRSLTDFVISATQEKAKSIVSDWERVLESQRDSEIFFDAIVNAEKPNKSLIEAAKQYNEAVSE